MTPEHEALVERLRNPFEWSPPEPVNATMHDAATAIEELTAQLRTIAEHWPGKWSRYCCGCDDEPWPCQVVLDVVVPWMEPEEVPE